MERKLATEVIANRDGTFLVVFGWREGREFFPAHEKPSKSYQTAAGMERARARWLAERR